MLRLSCRVQCRNGMRHPVWSSVSAAGLCGCHARLDHPCNSWGCARSHSGGGRSCLCPMAGPCHHSRFLAPLPRCWQACCQPSASGPCGSASCRHAPSAQVAQEHRTPLYLYLSTTELDGHDVSLFIRASNCFAVFAPDLSMHTTAPSAQHPHAHNQQTGCPTPMRSCSCHAGSASSAEGF